MGVKTHLGVEWQFLLQIKNSRWLSKRNYSLPAQTLNWCIRVDANVIFCTPLPTCLLATFETNQYLLKSNLMFSSFVKEIDVFILILCRRCNQVKPTVVWNGSHLILQIASVLELNIMTNYWLYSAYHDFCCYRLVAGRKPYLLCSCKYNVCECMAGHVLPYLYLYFNLKNDVLWAKF